MISMSTIHSIRQMRKNDVSIAEIARIAGISRTTVYAKLVDPDLSPEFPVKKTLERTLDELAADYASMRPMLFGSYPSIDEIVAYMVELEETINGLS